MSFALLNEEKSSLVRESLDDQRITFKFDLKALFLPIMQKNRRPIVLGAFLLLFHFVTLFALQIHSMDFPLKAGLMPSIHFVIAKFNILYLIEDPSTRIFIMYIFLGFNSIYMTSIIVLGFLNHLPRKHLVRVFLTRFHVYCFQVYNWVAMVFSIHISSNILMTDVCSDYCKILGIVNTILTILIANFIEYSRININFKCEDSLDSRVDLIDRVIINFKVFVIISSGVQFYIDYWLLLLFLLFLIDYLKKINYYVETISNFYISCILCFFFIDLVYFGFNHDFIDLQSLDVSYLLLFGCSFLLKTAFHLRGFLIIHKLKRIAKVGIKSKQDFDLYIKETYSNLHQFQTNLEGKILFLSFFSMHQNRCSLKECVCRTVEISTQTSYLKNKKTFKKVVENYFIEYLTSIKDQDYEDVFLMYCSFVTNILKTPSKALKLLIINRNKMKALKNRILIEILIKKSKKSLEKKLLNNDQYAQSFSTVIYFDYQIKNLESALRHIIAKEVQIGGILLNTIDVASKSFDAFFDIGKDVNSSIEDSKNRAKKLFDLNVNNIRLVQLTTLIIKYLSEDITFRNFYKQLNIKRINQDIQKRKKKDKTIDIFDNDAGVIFISLSKDLGFVKKFSKNVPKIFGCDSMEMKNRNINAFMPLVFSKSHDLILMNFINTGKATHLVTGLTQLYGVTKENLLLHLNLIIRLDTFFTKDFMIGAFIKTLRNTMSKTILLDIQGNFINCSKEMTNFLNFSKLSIKSQHSISMILLIPDIIDKLLPFKFDDILLKRNTDFKMKGFLLAPNDIDEQSVSSLSVKSEVYSSFKEFEATENSQNKFQELRAQISNKLSNFSPQDFKFYRIHFTLIIQNFRSNLVNIRMIEIVDILEINDMKLQIQYLSRKNKKIKDMIKNEANNKFSVPNANEILFNKKDQANEEPVLSNPHLPSPSRLLTIERDDEKIVESYVSVTNRTDIDKKLKILNESVNKIVSSDFLIPLKSETLNPRFIHELLVPNQLSEFDEENKPLKSEGESSDQNLLCKPQENKMMNSLSTIEQEESNISFEREGQDFEEKISEMSNGLMKQESDEGETLDDDITNTRGGSQVSRVSSHASNDGKKNTLEILNIVGLRKIQYLRVLNVFLFILFMVLTIVFYFLIQNEMINMNVTLKNSGAFHNQLSPLCILVRDSAIMKFLYGGLLDYTTEKKKDLIDEVKSSLEFNNMILIRSYKNGIGKADSSVDFVYTKFVNVALQNVTLYTKLVNNNLDVFIKHEVPIKYIENNMMTVVLNIPQCILFFLSASEHFYYVEVLQDVKNATDSYNYIFFLQENVLRFINRMLEVLEINKTKIGDSVSYLTNLNLAFFLITIFSILYAVSHSSYISIKSKFKANKFCALFFHFQEKEIEDRSNKLRTVLDRYFDQKNALFPTDISSLSKVQSKKQRAIDVVSTSKLELYRSVGQFAFVKGKHRKVSKRQINISHFRGRKFQLFLFIFFFGSFIIASSMIGIFLSNYIAIKNFSNNVIEIIGDLESVESYVLTLHIQYATNSILLGLYDENPTRKMQRIKESDDLLEIVDNMQGRITDLAVLFKVGDTDHILTKLKYEFFTKDICELYKIIKEDVNHQNEDVQEISKRLKGMDFCQKLLKNVMTKGSTSFAFEINEIFKQWQDYIRRNNFSSVDLSHILKSQEFVDINYALPYVYALGLYDISMMMSTSENYFEQVKNERVVWFIVCLIIITVMLTAPFHKLIQHLNAHSDACFSLIQIFPYSMISNNKMLENKITKITRQQKI